MTQHHPAIRPITAGWTLEVAPATSVPDAVVSAGAIPATVPGSVHTDLLAANLIPDPYLDDNEALLSWIGLADWTYSTSFDRPAGDADRTELVFAGLDTIATVRLNGVEIGATKNMHRTYRFDVTSALRDGSNDLVVEFASPIKYADAASLEIGYRPHVNHHPYNAVRKMACSYGWDWGIDTSSSGIWKAVTLESFSTARLGVVRPIATVDGTDGVVDVHVEIARTSDSSLTVGATVAGVSASVEVPAGATSATVQVRVPGVELWWPAGYGDQPLYDVDVTLSTGDDELDTASKRVGFRTVTFDTTPDDRGIPFTVEINGQAVFIKGANWIPDDAFPHRVDRARYERRMEQAQFANINLIRVWGGGIFEFDELYDVCDEKGILLWQDFLLACAAYAEEEPMYSEIEAEARDNVARLASHASLVVLNGNNENIWGYDEWNWEPRLQGKTWGEGYYYDLFPRIVEELAPHVGYTPGSPFTPGPVGGPLHGAAEPTPNDPDNGTMHIWDLWNQRDYPDYRTYEPRFVAEFGWQGPPTWSTLVASIHDEPLTPESPGMIVHQKAMLGNEKLTDGLVAHLPLPNEIDDWHWAMSLNQATAIGVAIDHFRSLQPHTMGSIVWQLNDCWPVTSWAAIDGYERPKPLLYALKHSYADRLVTIQPRGDALAAVVSNDTAEEWSGELVLRRVGFDGSELLAHSEAVTIAPRSTITVHFPSDVSLPGDARSELVVATLGDIRGTWFFAEYRDSTLGAAELETAVRRVDGGYVVEVTATTLVRDLALLVDKVDPTALASDMLVTLLPGETQEIHVTTDVELDASALVAPRVLRSANQLLHR